MKSLLGVSKRLALVLLLFCTGYGYAAASGLTNVYGYAKDADGVRTGKPVVARALEPHVMAVLASYFSASYGKHDPASNTWLTKVSDDYFTVSIRSIDRWQTADMTRFYVVTEGRGRGDHPENDFACHACHGLLGLLVLEMHDGKTEVIASMLKIESGSWGDPAPGEWILLNDLAYYGYRTDSSYSGQGITQTAVSVYAPYGKGFREILFLPVEYSDAGARGDENATSIEARLRVLLETEYGKVAPIEAHVAVSRPGSEKAGPTEETSLWLINFDEGTWKYRHPEKWPLDEAQLFPDLAP